MRLSSEQRGRPSRRQGGAIVEAAFLMPFVMVLLLGIWEVGRMVETTQILDNAAREGARAASTGQNNYAAVKSTVVNYLTQAGITTQTNLRVDVTNLTSNSKGPQTDGSVNGVLLCDYDPTQASTMDKIQVSITLPYGDVTWNTPRLVTSSNTQLNGTAVWNSLVDYPYPTGFTAPGGS